MQINGESIHGTTASVFPKVSWDGRSTTRRTADGKTVIYLQLFSRPKDGKLTVNNLINRPEQAAILGQPAKLEVAGKPGAWTIQLPDSASPDTTVVSLSFAGEPKLQAPAKSAPAAKKRK